MKFNEARLEFQVRYYSWASTDFIREIDASFPNLQLFKFGAIGKLHQFMLQIDREKQMVLARSLLKRFHLDAVKTLGESCSEEEISLRDDFDDFRRNQYWAEKEAVSKRSAGSKIKRVIKSKLREVMVSKFIESYGNQCIRMEIGKEWDPLFKMKCCGWILSTQLWFGRQESLIQYNHGIESETLIHHPKNPEITGPAYRLGQRLSFGGWLGACSQTQWEYLLPEDVEPACCAVIKLCGHFFEVAPKLLSGLEYEKITGQ